MYIVLCLTWNLIGIEMKYSFCFKSWTSFLFTLNQQYHYHWLVERRTCSIYSKSLYNNVLYYSGHRTFNKKKQRTIAYAYWMNCLSNGLSVDTGDESFFSLSLFWSSMASFVCFCQVDSNKEIWTPIYLLFFLTYCSFCYTQKQKYSCETFSL